MLIMLDGKLQSWTFLQKNQLHCRRYSETLRPYEKHFSFFFINKKILLHQIFMYVCSTIRDFLLQFI